MKAYYFDKSKMGPDESLVGVPADSLTQEQYDALPGYLRAAVDGHPAYRKAPAKDEAATPAEAPTKGKE